ncbi:AAA family ATPase [Rhizobium sp. A22-96]
MKKFRRFEDLEIRDIPPDAKLVVLAGPNGSGKSSVFDGLVTRYRPIVGYGWSGDLRYYNRLDDKDNAIHQRIELTTHEDIPLSRGSLYVRTAHRNDPDFVTNSLSRQPEILHSFNVQRLIEGDATVGQNYGRLAAQALEDVFINEAASTTMGDYRDRLIGEVREPLNRLFPGLIFTGVGNPLEHGTFQFEKGATKSFDYKNLSGGEKAAFDLILDIVVKRKSYARAIYCIDEPEAHVSTKIQGALLGELIGLLPSESQLWIASHSIGMMRKARELYDADPNAIVFLDFSGHDFDKATTITPSKPTRAFWESIMNVALDDLATLIAPREVVICEGNPAGPIEGRNAEHDARVYSTIFAEELPDVTFISAGSSNQVAGDFLGLAAVLPKVAAGMNVRRLIDRDDHAPADITTYNNQGITVLGRRHIESYLYDDEVLTALCVSVGKPGDASALLAAKAQAIAASSARSNPTDDIKSAAGKIYTEAKRILALTQVGNAQTAFARNTLAPLVKPGMAVYAELKRDIFGT